jgi:hypothetical protein
MSPWLLKLIDMAGVIQGSTRLGAIATAAGVVELVTVICASLVKTSQCEVGPSMKPVLCMLHILLLSFL